jgi:hypothetical protein
MWKYILAALLIAAVAACGGDSSGGGSDDAELPSDPGVAMLQLHEYVRNGQWARKWASLHAAHQEIATRGDFISCGGVTSAFSSRVIEVFDETIDVPRIGEVETKAVTIEVSVKNGGDEQSQRNTAHLIDVDGAWRWMLTDNQLDAYGAGDCP